MVQFNVKKLVFYVYYIKKKVFLLYYKLVFFNLQITQKNCYIIL